MLQISLITSVAALVSFSLIEHGANGTSYKALEKVGCFEDRDRLIRDLFRGYQDLNFPDNVTTKLGFTLMKIDVDVDRGLLISLGNLRMIWTDSRLAWDEADYGGISVLRITSKKVWVPDITLWNSNHPVMECIQPNVLIYPNGEILWVRACRFESFCDLTLASKGPYSEQTCILRFLSWTFDGSIMGLELYNGNASFDVMSEFFPQKFVIINNAAVRQETLYTCCEEAYLSLTYTVGFKRHGNLCDN